MPPIWFYFVIAAEFLWFLIETKWLTIRLGGDAFQKSAEIKATPPQAAACPPAPAQAPAQTQPQPQPPAETQPKA
jgi:hypothetical protein